MISRTRRVRAGVAPDEEMATRNGGLRTRRPSRRSRSEGRPLREGRRAGPRWPPRRALCVVGVAGGGDHQPDAFEVGSRRSRARSHASTPSAARRRSSAVASGATSRTAAPAARSDATFRSAITPAPTTSTARPASFRKRGKRLASPADMPPRVPGVRSLRPAPRDDARSSRSRARRCRIPTKCRPSFAAAASEVPEPQKGSMTSAPSRLEARTIRSSSFMGFCVGYPVASFAERRVGYHRGAVGPDAADRAPLVGVVAVGPAADGSLAIRAARRRLAA